MCVRMFRLCLEGRRSTESRRKEGGVYGMGPGKMPSTA